MWWLAFTRRETKPNASTSLHMSKKRTLATDPWAIRSKSLRGFMLERYRRGATDPAEGSPSRS